MVGVTPTDLAMLEDRVEQLERIYGKNASEKEAVKILEELNTKVDKMLGKHPKTQALLKRLNELSTYTNPGFIMRYDPSKFIQQEYVVGSTNRMQKAASDAKQIADLKSEVNPGNLKNVPELEKKMGPLTLKCLKLHDDGEAVNKEINELVGKWNEILNTLSEQFVTWDNILREHEEAAKDNE
ncbi:dynactin subunit 3-like [Bolinopsis microptera]|uniref:dynactin subunit 3-like n=1 Tax=Bolinopsis microptera TaxID=2820187 RepID=UPI003079E1D0